MKQETDRLYLTPMCLDDLEQFHATNVDSFVRKHLWDDTIISEDVSSDILSDVENHFEENNWGLWKIILKESEVYIGYVGLWRFFGEQQPQLLYAIFEEYTGNGFATEAAKKMVSYAFETLKYEYLVASMNVGNISSRNLCERIGLIFSDEKVIDGELTYFFKIANTSKS